MVSSLNNILGFNFICIIPSKSNSKDITNTTKKGFSITSNSMQSYETHLLITPPRAAGIRTSQSSTNIEFASIACASGKPLTPRFSFTCLDRLSMSIPFSFFMAPVMSLTATTFPPCSWMSFAAQEPTFPNP